MCSTAFGEDTIHTHTVDTLSHCLEQICIRRQNNFLQTTLKFLSLATEKNIMFTITLSFSNLKIRLKIWKSKNQVSNLGVIMESDLNSNCHEINNINSFLPFQKHVKDQKGLNQTEVVLCVCTRLETVASLAS